VTAAVLLAFALLCVVFAAGFTGLLFLMRDETEEKKPR